MFVHITNKRASKTFTSFLSKYKLKSASFLHEQEKLASYGYLRVQDILFMLNRERWSFISMWIGGSVFPGGLDGKKFACNEGDLVQSLCGEDPLEKGMATHSSSVAWRIPCTEEPGGLQFMGSQRVRHDLVTK